MTPEQKKAINKLLKGRGCRFSSVWLKRGSKRKDDDLKRGTLLGISKEGFYIRVKWDNVKQPHTYAVEFIEAI